MNAFEFSKYAINICSQFDFIKGLDVLILDEPVAKIRAIIDDNVFINIFYNSENLKYSFALVKSNRRIFGADNTKNGIYIRLITLTNIRTPVKFL